MDGKGRGVTLQGINIFPPKGKFGKSSTQNAIFRGDMLVPWRVYLSPINGLIKGLFTYIYILDIWISSWGLPKKIHGTSPEVVWFRTCQTAKERISNTNFHWDTPLKLNIWNQESSKKWRGKWSEPSTCVWGFKNLIFHGVPLNIQIPSNTNTSCELVIQVFSQELDLDVDVDLDLWLGWDLDLKFGKDMSCVKSHLGLNEIQNLHALEVKDH